MNIYGLYAVFAVVIGVVAAAGLFSHAHIRFTITIERKSPLTDFLGKINSLMDEQLRQAWPKAPDSTPRPTATEAPFPFGRNKMGGTRGTNRPPFDGSMDKKSEEPESPGPKHDGD